MALFLEPSPRAPNMRSRVLGKMRDDVRLPIVHGHGADARRPIRAAMRHAGLLNA